MLQENLKKYKIIHIVGSFYPAIDFGGPIFSTKRICDVLLKEEAFNLKVISFNYKTPKKNSFLNKNDLNFIKSTKKYKIKWINMKSKFNGFISFLWTSLVSIYRGDLIHLTGLFNLYALITVLFCFFFQKKLIISARGSLQALYEYDEVRNKMKLSYLKLLSFFLSNRRCFWLATTNFEAKINTSFVHYLFLLLLIQLI